MQGMAVWRELQLLLSLNLPESAYYVWEGTAICCHCDDQRLVIGAPTEQSARQLVQAYLPVVRRTLQAIPDAPKRVSVVVTTGTFATATMARWRWRPRAMRPLSSDFSMCSAPDRAWRGCRMCGSAGCPSKAISVHSA